MMVKLIKYFICFLLLTVVSVANAINLIPLTFSVSGSFSVGTVVEPVNFVPIERITRYSLAIDAEKSYFYVEKNPSSYTYFRSGLIFDFPDAPETLKYSISGKINIFDEHIETKGFLRDKVKITSIDIESLFNNIDLSAYNDFWNEDYILKYHFVDKIPSYMICACSIDLSGINFSGPLNEAVFDGQKLEYTGKGLFKKDDDSDMFLLESSFDATHKISYHIEANVVSSVPIPAAFYLFFSGVVGLLISRVRMNS